MIEFIQVPAFFRRLDVIAGKQATDVLLSIENDLLADPERGKLVPGLGGIRKARAADPTRGKGKRGGFRYLYFYLERDGEIYLLFIFNKNEREDLTNDERNQLRGMIEDLKEARHGD